MVTAPARKIRREPIDKKSTGATTVLPTTAEIAKAVNKYIKDPSYTWRSLSEACGVSHRVLRKMAEGQEPGEDQHGNGRRAVLYTSVETFWKFHVKQEQETK